MRSRRKDFKKYLEAFRLAAQANLRFPAETWVTPALRSCVALGERVEVTGEPPQNALISPREFAAEIIECWLRAEQPILYRAVGTVGKCTGEPRTCLTHDAAKSPRRARLFSGLDGHFGRAIARRHRCGRSSSLGLSRCQARWRCAGRFPRSVLSLVVAGTR
jgi:hypothetical protein